MAPQATLSVVAPTASRAILPFARRSRSPVQPHANPGADFRPRRLEAPWYGHDHLLRHALRAAPRADPPRRFETRARRVQHHIAAKRPSSGLDLAGWRSRSRPLGYARSRGALDRHQQPLGGRATLSGTAGAGAPTRARRHVGVAVRMARAASPRTPNRTSTC